MTNPWQEYTGNRPKEFHNIRLKDGREIYFCWPNADSWNPMVGGTVFHDNDVSHIQPLTEDEVDVFIEQL